MSTKLIIQYIEIQNFLGLGLNFRVPPWTNYVTYHDTLCDSNWGCVTAWEKLPRLNAKGIWIHQGKPEKFGRAVGVGSMYSDKIPEIPEKRRFHSVCQDERIYAVIEGESR